MKKKITIFSVCFVAGLLLVTCKENTGNKPESSKVLVAYTLNVMPQNGVPFDTAFLDIRRYVTECNLDFGNMSHKVIRSYTVSAKDMLGVMQMNQEDFAHLKYDSCRVYLGLNHAGQFKLYMTPVKNTKDVFLYYVRLGSEYGERDTMYYVYDLNAPCPKTCDTLSPFYDLDSSKYWSR